ncbi:MAG: twin-arginine translocation signal domain-containing protein, partial [Gemmatimonadetes bacterium]|nr:twin-arginine translocation signal domain-containing protein [Gemmatimonadota bacterium]
MLIKRPDDIETSEITPEDTYLNRRKFIEAAGILGAAAALPVLGSSAGRRVGGSPAPGGASEPSSVVGHAPRPAHPPARRP